MSFSLFFPGGDDGGEKCNRLNHFDEGVELTFCLSSALMKRIPIAFIFSIESRANQNPIPMGTHDNLSLCGYSLEMDQVVLLQQDYQRKFNYTLCSPQLPEFYGSDYIQFRWLQTSEFNNNNNHRDV